MNSIEDQLRALPRTLPSKQLDRRMEALFARRRARPWWWLAAAGAVAAGLVFATRPLNPAPAPADVVVYQFEADETLRDWLRPPAEPLNPPTLIITVSQ